jgi:flagellin
MLNGISANTNLAAMRGLSALSTTTLAVNKSMERLATGQRINRASDDPAGMVAGEDLKAREKTILAKMRTLDREEYSLGAKEGVYSVLSDSFIELRGLITQAANTSGTSKEEKQAIQDQIDGAIDGIDFVLATSTFDKQQIMQGLTIQSFGKQSRSSVNDKGEKVTENFSIADLKTGGRLNALTGELDMASLVVDKAVSDSSGTRSAIGSRMKSIDTDRNTLWAELQGVTSEKSRILDTDYGSETANFVRQQVLQAAALRVTQVAIQQQRQQVSQLLGVLG